MNSSRKISNPKVWQLGDRPVVVQTASGSEYCVHSNGIISGGMRKLIRKPLIGAAREPGGPLLRGQAIVIGLRMVIDETKFPPMYTSPVTDIIPKTKLVSMKRTDIPDIETWCPGDGPIAVRTTSGAEYYIDNDGLVSGGSRPIAGRELMGAVRNKNGPLWGERAVMIGFGMEIKCGNRLLYTSPVAEIIRYTKRPCK